MELISCLAFGMLVDKTTFINPIKFKNCYISKVLQGQASYCELTAENMIFFLVPQQQVVSDCPL